MMNFLSEEYWWEAFGSTLDGSTMDASDEEDESVYSFERPDVVQEDLSVGYCKD